MIASQFITVLVVCLFLSVGLLLYVFYRRPDVMGAAAPGYVPAGKLDAAYPRFILREMPTVLSGLAIAGFFAVAQGSMDSAINAMASSAVADLYFPLRRRLGSPVDEARPSRGTAAGGRDRRRGPVAVRRRLREFLYDPRAEHAAGIRPGHHELHALRDARRVPDGPVHPPGERCQRRVAAGRRGDHDRAAAAGRPAGVDGQAVRTTRRSSRGPGGCRSGPP